MRLHHVQVSMPRGQEDLARRFYQDALGLVEVLAEVHLGVDAPFVPAAKAHPALVGDTVDELEHRAAAITGAGFEVSWAERKP